MRLLTFLNFSKSVLNIYDVTDRQMSSSFRYSDTVYKVPPDTCAMPAHTHAHPYTPCKSAKSTTVPTDNNIQHKAGGRERD